MPTGSETAPSAAPLSTLLAQVWIAHVIEVDNAFEVNGGARVGGRFRILLPLWTNGLRFISGEGITVGDLRSRVGAGLQPGWP